MKERKKGFTLLTREENLIFTSTILIKANIITQGIQEVSGKINKILSEMTSTNFLTKTNIANYKHFLSHQKIDLFILLINQLYQRIAIVWQIIEKAKVV